MIENEEGRTYLGLINQGHGTLIVFREGVLVLDDQRPGWGVMSRAALRELLPVETASRSSSSSSSGSNDEASDADSRSSLLSTSNSGDDAGVQVAPRSGSQSPVRSAAHRQRASWRPSIDALGWHASEAPTVVAPATLETILRMELADGPARETLIADLRAGRLAPPSANQPAIGVLVLLTVFGEPCLLAWQGRWAPAGDPVPLQHGFTPQLAGDIARRAKVADMINVSALVLPETLVYEGVVRGPQLHALAFEGGLLVLEHADPQMRGWHDLQTEGNWNIVSSESARMLNVVADSPYLRSFQITGSFLNGNIWGDPGTDFYALVYSTPLGSWRALHQPSPMEWLPAGDPRGPQAGEIDRLLSQAVLAPFHDWQCLTDRDGTALDAGGWQVSWVLGAVRLLTVSGMAPELLKTCWHDTLMSALQTLLQTHRAQEPSWLAAGLIRQPVAALLALAQRDVRLRRPEVWLSWPGNAIDDLFKTLAPRARVRAVPNPAMAAIEQALAADKPVLLLFQSSTSPAQGAVLAWRGRCHESGSFVRPVESLMTRARLALDPKGHEHLVAMVLPG